MVVQVYNPRTLQEDCVYKRIDSLGIPCFEKVAPGLPMHSGMRREVFPQVHLTRHSEASVAIVLGYLAVAFACGKTWHHLHGFCFIGMQSTRFAISGRL